MANHEGQVREHCDDGDAAKELAVQKILTSRCKANASGQDGKDTENIRAALFAARPDRPLMGECLHGR